MMDVGGLFSDFGAVRTDSSVDRGSISVRATQVFERQQNALLGAAQRDDVVAIKNILQSGAAVSYANSVGQTALHIATLWGNASAVEALVQAGAAGVAEPAPLWLGQERKRPLPMNPEHG